MSLTKSCNFCVHENKVFDLDGYEILPDEDNIVCVFLNGMERRFKIDKMIVWLKESGYSKLFREPKQVKVIVKKEPKEPKPIKEKTVKVAKVKITKPKKEKSIKIPRQKKEPTLCKCGSVMFGKVSCQKCRTANKQPQYKKVEFDKRKIKGRENNHGYPKRKVSCSNGKEYKSLYEAGEELNLTRSQIWHVCTGKWKHTNGLIFKYV